MINVLRIVIFLILLATLSSCSSSSQVAPSNESLVFEEGSSFSKDIDEFEGADGGDGFDADGGDGFEVLMAVMVLAFKMGLMSLLFKQSQMKI